MVLVIDRYYPDADTYSGEAGYINVEFGTLPVPFLFESLPDQMIQSVLTTINEKGGKPLRVLVWREEHLDKYVFTVGVYYYVPSGVALTDIQRAELNPIALLPYIIAGILVLIGIYLIYQLTKAATTLIWSPGGIPWIAIAIAVVGVSLGVAYLYKTLKKQGEGYGQATY